MTTRQIDYILGLAQTQNFSRAVENHYISQPTMTYQINAAENEIGFRIFDRSGKGASLICITTLSADLCNPVPLSLLLF